MEIEKSELLQLNLELQKKASNLLFREKVSTVDDTVRSLHQTIEIAYLVKYSLIAFTLNKSFIILLIN